MKRMSVSPISLVRLCALVLVLLPVAACVAPGPPQVTSHVTRFADFAGSPAGQTFIVVPLAHQKQSAEYSQYRREIEAHLVAQGLRAVDPQDQADYLVTFDYAIGAHDESRVVQEYGTVVPSHTVTTTELYYNSLTDTYEPQERIEYVPSVYGVTGYHTVTETVYDRSFTLRMFDLHRSSGDDLYPAYEGTVASSGSTPSFAGVSACLFDALFSNFLQPGTQDTSQPGDTCMR